MPKGVTDHTNLENPNKLSNHQGPKGGFPDPNFSENGVTTVDDIGLPEGMTADEANIFVNLAAILGTDDMAQSEIMHVMNQHVLQDKKISIETIRELVSNLKTRITSSRHALDLYWDTKHKGVGAAQNIRTIDSALNSIQFLVLEVASHIRDAEENFDFQQDSKVSLDDIDKHARILERLSKTQSAYMDTLSRIRQKTSEILLSDTIKNLASEVQRTPSQTARVLSDFLKEHEIDPQIADRVAARFLSAKPSDDDG